MPGASSVNGINNTSPFIKKARSEHLLNPNVLAVISDHAKPTMFALEGKPHSVIEELPGSPMLPVAFHPITDDGTETGAFPLQVCACKLILVKVEHKANSKKLLIFIKFRVNKSTLYRQ